MSNAMRRVLVLVALALVLSAAVATAAVATPAVATATVVPAAVATQESSRAQAAQTFCPLLASSTFILERVTFAVIGDQGRDSDAQRSVVDLVQGWKPDFMVSGGDNYYRSAGGSGLLKYDTSVGAYYCPWLKGVAVGQGCPSGGNASLNSFYPTLGNHDYSDSGLDLYLSYFDLPGAGQASSSNNERYYDVVRGPIHLFVLNSNKEEPDGVRADGEQGAWLKQQLAKSTKPWKLVVFHHAAYSSGDEHGSSTYMQWPFAEWGADAILSGHDHTYERVMVDGIPYFVNGLGGASRYDFGTPVEGSAVRFNATWGAQRVTATDSTLTFEFIALNGLTVDNWTISK